VAAVSDDAFSGESLMRRAANIINSVCNRIINGADGHLYYEFQEERGYLPADRYSNGFTRFFRRRRISRKFVMDESLEIQLKRWLGSGRPKSPLRWASKHIDVVITWKDHVHPMGNTFSSMPSVVHHVRDNPLYEVLKAKARQIKGAPAGTRRVIFLGDAGCHLLRDLRSISSSLHSVTGHDIIQTFLAENPIDLVVVFSPTRSNEYAWPHFNNPMLWRIQIFDRRTEAAQEEFDRLLGLRDLLPTPFLYGYQARSWHQQGLFDPQGRGQYLPPSWTTGRDHMTVRISARCLQEYIAGKISREQFERWGTGEHNLFGNNLTRGRTISNVHFVPKGNDEDDDYIVFEFAEDPAATSLKAHSSAEDKSSRQGT
jgi:hypothetical protein